MISSSLQIVDIQRPVEVPQEGLLCDILWSDPDKVFMLLLTYIIRLLNISAASCYCLSCLYIYILYEILDCIDTYVAMSTLNAFIDAILKYRLKDYLKVHTH